MVAAETNDARVLPVVQRGRRGVVQDLAVALLHLLEGMRGIEGRDGNITTVDDL